MGGVLVKGYKVSVTGDEVGPRYPLHCRLQSADGQQLCLVHCTLKIYPASKLLGRREGRERGEEKGRRQ